MSSIEQEARLLEAALALREARDSKQPIPPISKTFGIEGLNNAYAVSAINTKHRIESGARAIGKKVGLTSQSVQRQLGVDQPDFGVLFADMEYLDGEAIPMSRLLQPKAEVEIAFIVEKDLTVEKPSWGEFINSLAYALPALEIVDSAIESWQLSLVDTVADNASCGLYVLGNQPINLGRDSLADVGMQLLCNGELVSVGTGAACLEHPLRAAYWMAQMMADQGEGLSAGEAILSGALGPMISIKAGDLLQAQVGSLGAISCQMV